jgi:hypothetical protein
MAPKKISRKDAKRAKIKTGEGGAKKRKERKKETTLVGEAPERPQGVSREIDWSVGIR